MKEPVVFELTKTLSDDILFYNCNNSAVSKDSQTYRNTAYVFTTALDKDENEETDESDAENLTMKELFSQFLESEITLQICTMENDVLFLEDDTSGSDIELIREDKVSSTFPSRQSKVASIEKIKSIQSTSESMEEWSRYALIEDMSISPQSSDDGANICGEDISGKLKTKRSEESKTTVRSALSLVTANLGSRILNFFLRKNESNV